MKKLFMGLMALVLALQVQAAEGWPSKYEGVMLQGFYWDSYSDTNWKNLTAQADELSKYFSLIWVPNSGNCNQAQSMGYTPVYWFDHKSSFGAEDALRTMIKTFKEKGTGIIEDVVINHKNGKGGWCDFATETWNGNTVSWTMADICKNDECASNGYNPRGNYDTGDNFDGSRDLDHTSENVQKNVKVYLDFLLNDLGYAGFRYDMVKGYGAEYTKMYNQSANPRFSVGEYWDGSYETVCKWINATGKTSAAFDYPLKYVIKEAFGNSNWSALSNKGIAGNCGVGGMSRYSVTFVDNHDTGQETNNDILRNNVVAANAFILALPGTPCIFLPHWKKYKSAIGPMILARNAAGINNESSIIDQYQKGGYVMKTQGTKGSVMVICGYVENADVTGYKCISAGENYAFYLSEGLSISEGGGTETQPHDITVHVSADKAPYLYMWDSEQTISGAWPGDVMTETTTTKDGKTWWVKTVSAVSFNMILNNGDDKQTSDIMGVTEDIYLTYNGGTSYNNVTSQYDGSSSDLPECAQWVDDAMFCYFEANSTYTSPNIWAWGDGDVNFTGGKWPGQKMTQVGTTKDGKKVYLWNGGAIGEAMPTGVVFSDGTGSPQTSDFIFMNGGYYNVNGLVGQVEKPQEQGLKGDSNNDGNVSMADANLVVNAYTSGDTSVIPSIANADVTADGDITMADANGIVNIYVGQ